MIQEHVICLSDGSSSHRGQEGDMGSISVCIDSTRYLRHWGKVTTFMASKSQQCKLQVSVLKSTDDSSPPFHDSSAALVSKSGPRVDAFIFCTISKTQFMIASG